MKIIEIVEMFQLSQTFLKVWLDKTLNKENAQTIKDSFENILISSKRKPNLIESD